MASSLTVSGSPVSLSQLADHLQAQEFIHSDDFAVESSAGGSPSAFFAGHGRNNGDQGSGGRTASGGRGRHGRGRGNNNGRGRGGTPRCQICKSHGHTAVNCFKRYAERPQPHAGQANVAVTGEPQVADAWYPDTGASSHVTPDEQMLHHSEAYTGGDVLKVGNDAGLDISCVGHAVIPSRSKNLQMSNILHVPNLTLPLLSVYRFANENNVFFEFHKDLFLVKDSNTQTALLKGSTSAGLYKLLVPRAHFAFLSTQALSQVWHQRLHWVTLT
ncbi:PREDICTED: uncharacterized protein LOC109149527 [Ipomoea nil]|uniref:uncharacterized protein LOC109149527 n=1 Tax=Ipomoea nil TaxID=35883 RepID=UPI000900DE86|nr:PREDICTED: uncharacterized protein LOC109149527 [Ipomoea nil]